MTSCTTNVCGVGGWGGPLPGDPSNNANLTATPAFGGIDVNWTYPTTNPFAVAYTKIYRGLSDNFNSAILIKEVAGTFYYDRQDNQTRYYYWIRLVSVNGTEGDLIGPASAQAKPLIEDMIERLTGQIDAGLLATTLRTRIDHIALLDNALTAEVRDRESGETTLSQAIAAVQAGVAEAHTFILSEAATRTTQNTALAQQITGVAATAGAGLAAATTTLRAYVDSQHSAAVSQINDVYTQLNGDISAVTVAIDTWINESGSVSSDVAATNARINALYTVRLTVNNLVGGFGLANNGNEVEAGFDVDKFWVGRTNADKRKPFIIADGVVYLDDAVINKLTFSKLRDESGSFIVQGGKIKADYITVVKLMGGQMTGYESPATTLRGFYLGPEGFLIGNETDNRFFKIDANTGTVSAPGFSITNGQALFSGSISAATIAVGLGSAKTTFFDPLLPSASLRSVATGSMYHDSRVYGANQVITNDTVKFKCLDPTWNEARRIRAGNITFQLLATGAVEQLFALWVRKNGGSWQCLRAVTEPGNGVGACVIAYQHEVTASVNDVYEFGISNTDANGNQFGSLDYAALFNASINVTVVNF